MNHNKITMWSLTGCEIQDGPGDNGYLKNQIDYILNQRFFPQVGFLFVVFVYNV